MDLVAALEALQNCNELPNRAQIYAAISSELEAGKGLKEERDRLTQNNADLLKQKSAKVKEIEKLQKDLADVIKAVGVEGESTEKQFTRLKELADLKSTLEAKIATLEAEKKTEADARSQAEKRTAEIERSLNNQKAAIKLGADADALNQLVTQPLTIDGDTVYVLGENDRKTELKEFAKAQGEWFDRALFPVLPTPEPAPADPATNTTTTPPAKPAPGAPPAKPLEAKPLVSTYLTTAGYTGPRKKENL